MWCCLTRESTQARARGEKERLPLCRSAPGPALRQRGARSGPGRSLHTWRASPIAGACAGLPWTDRLPPCPRRARARRPAAAGRGAAGVHAGAGGQVHRRQAAPAPSGGGEARALGARPTCRPCRAGAPVRMCHSGSGTLGTRSARPTGHASQPASQQRHCRRSLSQACACGRRCCRQARRRRLHSCAGAVHVQVPGWAEGPGVSRVHPGGGARQAGIILQAGGLAELAAGSRRRGVRAAAARLAVPPYPSVGPWKPRPSCRHLSPPGMPAAAACCPCPAV